MNGAMRIGDICDILNGYVFKSSKYVTDGIRVIRITNVQKGFVEDTNPQYYPMSEQRKIEKYMLCEGDLLMSLTGNVGRVGLIGADMLPAALNQRVACLRIKDPTVIYKPFLFHLLNSDLFENQCILASKGIAQKNMSTEWLKEYRIPLLPIKKQVKIASIFDKIDALIISRKEQVRNLEQVVKSRFVELFGDLKINAHGWETVTLDNCFEITSSKRILKSEWQTEGIPFLRVRDMVQLATTGTIDNEFFVSEEFYSTLSDTDGIPQSGDILVSATSTIGKCYVVKNGERFYFKDADVLRFRSKYNIDPVFFIEQLKTNYVGEQISRTLGVTTVPHFTIKAAKTIKIRLPKLSIQQQFAAFVKQVDKSKYCSQKFEELCHELITIYEQEWM